MHNKELVRLRKQLSEFLTGYWKTQTVYVTVKLGIFDSLAEKQVTVTEIAEEKGLDPAATERLFWGLVALKLVRHTSGGFFKLTDLGEVLVKDKPGSLGHAALVWGSEHYTAWSMLEKSLKTGKSSFKTLFGKKFFTWLPDHPEKADIYHKAMVEYAEFDYLDVTEKVDFGKHRVVMDVGGGLGVLLSMILSKNPSVKGILVEQPRIEQLARKYLASKGVLDRSKFVNHDFFETFTERADAIVLSRVLHDWSDEKVSLILQNCVDALEPGGRIYVLELCVSEEKPEFGALLNLNMLVMTGGRERTGEEYEELGKQVGLELIDQISLQSVSSLLVFGKVLKHK
ncbi:MAG: methyltransferase [Promethearchaeota archaeon]|jgi:SAM-dependent methyltransferase